ncbi:MAG: CoB--CoM heterodisulfide reductase iron-sulfur subunit B family protein [Thermoplasmata archaeon]|nr:CoB--CoM heterodisulfide reductase iron-sulfur subunit B family protein [Thermoplasmata archaeon]RLF28319.1 MAG: heterodisulfide reductase subunit B [Thermoplasmata archaeon]
MKKYTLYPGCVMQTEQYGYELSIREVFPVLGVELVDVENFSCCGEPVKSINQLLTLYLSARNLAIAEQQGFDLFVPCSVCHFALSECKNILDNDGGMRSRVNEMLASEDLEYKGKVGVVHTVDLLYDHVGVKEIKKHVKKPLKGLKIASHYGCHLVRPSEIGRPVDSENPMKIEAVLEALGAETMDYAEKLDCCGGLLLVNLPESALTKTGQKLQAVEEHGFDGLVTVCPWCQRMFDSRQKKAGETVAAKLEVPVFYLTQLLGLAFGLDERKLGLDLNLSPVDKLKV